MCNYTLHWTKLFCSSKCVITWHCQMLRYISLLTDGLWSNAPLDMVKLKNSEKNPLHCHFVCNKSHFHWPGIEVGASVVSLWQTSWAHCLHGPQIITVLNKPSRYYSNESLSDTSRTTTVGSVPCSSSHADSIAYLLTYSPHGAESFLRS